jgi:hypothetical protein
MATTHPNTQHRIAGSILIVGTLMMATGAAIGASFGTFVDTDLEQGTFADYLANAAANTTAAKANLWLWILGVLAIGIGGVMLTKLGDEASLASRVARFSFTAAPAAAMVFYPMLLGVAVVLAPLHVAGQSVEATATALAYIGTTADWIATVVLLGLGVATLAYAGRDTWVPRWLLWWGFLAGAVGIVSLIGNVAGSRESISVLILPVSMPWLIAAGIMAIKYRNVTGEEGAHRESADHPAAR